jgi:hypothetical protein
MQVFEILLEHCNKEQLDLMAVMVRRIWFRRNLMVFEGDFTHLTQVFHEAVVSIEEYKRCHKETQIVLVEGQAANMQPISWKPPPPGLIKVN